MARTPPPLPRRIARLLVLLPLLGAAACGHRLTAAQIAVLREQGFVAKDDAWELNLSDRMLFDTASDRLKEPTRAAIQRTGAALKSVEIRHVRVEGHTDNVGADDYNLALSQRRAATVAQALEQQGVGQVGTRGMGKQFPVADNATDAGRAENRRVAVIVPSEQE